MAHINDRADVLTHIPVQGSKGPLLHDANAARETRGAGLGV